MKLFYDMAWRHDAKSSFSYIIDETFEFSNPKTMETKSYFYIAHLRIETGEACITCDVIMQFEFINQKYNNYCNKERISLLEHQRAEINLAYRCIRQIYLCS